MAKKPSISTITSGYTSTTTLNANFEALRDGFDNTLSLDGSTPNAMNADFDMNSNDILNANEVNASALRLGGVLVSASNLNAAGATLYSDNYTGDGSTVAYSMSYQPFIKDNTQVYIDGVYQNKAGYETSGTTLTFSEAPPLNSNIEIVVARSLDVAGTSSANVDYDQGGSGSVTRTVETKLQEFVSVKDFGAVGDGVSDDTAAIQAADAAASAAGKYLFLPAGVYNVAGRSAAITPTTTWVGEASWYNQFTVASPLFDMPDVGTVIDGGSTNLDILSANWTARNIEGINFRGSGTGSCIHMTSGSRLSRVFNCAFYGKEHAVRVSGAVAYLLRFDRIFAVKQSSHAVFFDWGSGSFNDISLTNSWILRPDGNGVRAVATTGGCTIFEVAHNSITDGTGDNAAIIFSGIQGGRIIGNDIEGWGAIYPNPDVLSGKTGYQPNAIAMQVTGQSIIIEGNVTYGGGNNNAPIKLLTARQVRIGPNRLLKDLSTQAYAISVDTASNDVVIDPQTVDYPNAALISAAATDVINNATGQPDFQTPILASKNVLFPAPQTVASASTITIPDAPVVKISGTTSITFITGKPYQIVTLEFEDILTVVDAPPGVGNLRLNGDFTTSAGSTLTLMARGAAASWVEISRSLNS